MSTAKLTPKRRPAQLVDRSTAIAFRATAETLHKKAEVLRLVLMGLASQEVLDAEDLDPAMEAAHEVQTLADEVFYAVFPGPRA